MSAENSQATQNESAARRRVKQYMLDGESIATGIRVRRTGIIAWIKSLFGIGVTHWFVTNQRLVQDRRFWGGFSFQDIPHKKITSIEYGSKVPLVILGLGILLFFAGLLLGTEVSDIGAVIMILGLIVIAYAFYRRRQVLIVHGSGGTKLSLVITKGVQVDELILYLHAARNRRESAT